MRGAVLITGASTGIGEASARRLARAGFRVFAGVRKPADAERLRAAGAEPLTIDVTDGESIAAAAEEIGESALAGLVNNAGITVSGPLEYVPLDDIRRQFEVNTFGQIAVTQAFMPMLRRARGRIVFVSSVGGLVAPPLVGPYAGSKGAIRLMADSLRQELRPWGLEVSSIEPGTVATPIWDKGETGAARAIEALPPEGRERYERALRRGSERVVARGHRGISPDRVARVVEHALTARRPRTHYLVGDAHVQWWLSRLLPDRVFDRVVARFVGIG